MTISIKSYRYVQWDENGRKKKQTNLLKWVKSFVIFCHILVCSAYNCCGIIPIFNT